MCSVTACPFCTQLEDVGEETIFLIYRKDYSVRMNNGARYFSGKCSSRYETNIHALQVIKDSTCFLNERIMFVSSDEKRISFLPLNGKSRFLSIYNHVEDRLGYWFKVQRQMIVSIRFFGVKSQFQVKLLQN